MILLQVSQSNTIATTFTENTTLTGSVYYLWDAISDDTDVSKTFIAQDTSTNEFRYNLFNLTLTGSEDLLSGSIDLEVGTYKYNVHQQNSATNLTASLSGTIVERGRIYVSGSVLPTIVNYSGSSAEDIVYNG
jgi:hypothetical protein